VAEPLRLKTRGPSLAEQAYRRLEEMLVTLQLAPGQFLSEEELSRQLEIGRTPVREALKRLAAEGLITILPRRGLLVTEIDAQHELYLLEVRRELERLAARRCAVQRSAAEAERFARLAEAMETAVAAEDERAYLRVDKEFNDLLLGVSGNPIVQQTLAPLHTLSRRFWYSHYGYVRRRTPLGADVHAPVMRAIAAGDPEAAAQAVDRLMDYVEDLTRSMLRPRAEAVAESTASGVG